MKETLKYLYVKQNTSGYDRSSLHCLLSDRIAVVTINMYGYLAVRTLDWHPLQGHPHIFLVQNRKRDNTRGES